MSGPIGLVAIDLDGTLVQTETLKISERDRRAIQTPAARGVQVVIATARTPGVAMRFSHDLGLAAPVIGNNGASAAGHDGTVLIRRMVAPECAGRILALIPPDAHLSWVDWDRILIGERPDAPPGIRMQRAGPYEWEIEVVPRNAFPITGGASAIGAFGDAIEPIVAAVSGEPVCPFRYYRSGTLTGVIFIDAHASKGDAVRAIAERSSIPRPAVLAIGDSEADVSMFTAAGIAVAMADAPDDVKAQASWVTRSQAEHGVAHALERFVLDA